ncbi:ALQxL family class IV lanthipeptide [Streptosporangium fragile]
MELDITALDMLPAAEESKLKDCNVTCGLHTGTCSGQTMCHQTW